jgi:hypothetical protein
MNDQDTCVASRAEHPSRRSKHPTGFHLICQGRGHARRPSDAQAHLVINHQQGDATEIMDFATVV